MAKSKLIKALKIILTVVILVIIGTVLGLCALLELSPFDLLSQNLPTSDTIIANYETEYLTESTSDFEKQGFNQCAGYSSAYLLRLRGEEITGKEAYQKMGRKFHNGYVLPIGISNLIADYGYGTTLMRGNLSQLKTRVASGSPVIALIGDGTSWQHYVTVVGYDQDQIYLYDSIYPNDSTSGYNRVMSNREFLSRWQNGIPLFEQVYLVLS